MSFFRMNRVTSPVPMGDFRVRSFIAASVICVGSLHCVTAEDTTSAPQERNAAGGDARTKPAPKAQTLPAGSVVSSGAVAPSPAQGPTDKQLFQFLLGQWNASPAPLDAQDEKMFADIPSGTAPGSFGEAAASVYILARAAGRATPSAAAFVESDVTAGTPTQGTSQPAQVVATTAQKISVESEARRKGVDIAQALERHPLLQSWQIHRLAREGIDLSQDTEEYKAEVLSAIRRVTEQWTKLAQSLPGHVPPSATLIAPAAGAAATQVVTPGAPASVPGPIGMPWQQPPPQGQAGAPVVPPAGAAPFADPATMDKDQLALAEAQALADGGNYSGAIARISKIPPSSPSYGVSLERTRNFSNKAVQDLRMKAADAFQKSLPLSDPKARVSYLERAKVFLEEALKSYPSSDFSRSIQENLTVISQDINRLKGE